MMSEEAARDPYNQASFDAPKYSVCFMDLAEFLGLKEDVFTKLNETINEEASLIDPQDLVAFSSRKERDERVRSNSTQREQKEMVNKLLEGQE